MKEITQSTTAGERPPSAVASIDRRTLLKLTGAATLTGGFASGTAAADGHLPEDRVTSEVEGTLVSVNGDGTTISVMGIEADVSNASITSPTGSLTPSQLADTTPFPGRSQPGFVGGTAVPVGSVNADGTNFVADSLFVEIAEHVVLGPVTINEVGDDGFQSDEDQFYVQGVRVLPVDINGDARMTFRAVHGDLNTAVDVGSLEEGALVSVEGHFGGDGILYAHTLEAEEGSITEDIALNITRAEFEDGDEIRVQGTVSETDGTVILDNNKDGAERIVYGDEPVQESDAADVGQFQFDYREDDIEADLNRDDLGDGLIRVTYIYPDGTEGAQATAEPE